MEDYRVNLWTIRILLCIAPVLCQDMGLLISRSADFFDKGFFESIPGTPTDIKNEIESSFSGEPTSYKIDHDEFETDVQAMVNDPFEQKLYFLEKDTRSLYRMDNFDLKFEHPNRTITSVHAGVSESTTSIAFDWIRKVLYWVDTHHGWVCLQPAYTSDPTMYAVVIRSVSYPSAITLDAIQAKMFYFDLRSSSGRISSATLSGDDQRVITHRTLGFVSSMVADPTEQRLYVLDSERMVMESMTYFGNDRRSIRKLPGYNMMSMTITREDICVAEPNSYFVACFLKTDGSLNMFMSYWFNAPRAASYYDSAFLVTNETDICKDKNCEHICVSNGTSAHACLCKEGFTLNSDGRTCSEDKYLHPSGVLFTNGTHICMSEVRTMSGGNLDPICLRANFSNVRHLAADARTNTVFYYDMTHSEISAHDIITGATTVLASAGNVTGLVYDWLTKNLYWAERLTDSGDIRVVNVIDKASSVLYSGITGLGPIAVSPHNRTLFWMAETDGSVSIYAGSMDGSNMTVIVRPEDTFIPSAMYADPYTGRLFYLDFFTLVAINPDGSDPIVLYTSVVTSDLVIYKRYALWISDQDRFLYGTSYLSPNKDTMLHDEEFGQVTALAVFDIALQIQELSVCSKVPNGGCSDICLPSDSGPVCKCSFGLILSPNNKTCVSVPMTDNFLLISDIANYNLYQVSLVDGNNITLLESEPSFYATGSAYNPADGRIYVTDAFSASIFSMLPSGSNRTTVVQFSDKIPERLTFDSSTGNVYYTVSDVFNLSPDGYVGVYSPTHMVHKTLVENLNSPRGLAVFPSEGLLFVADYGAFSASIFSVWMDGSNRTDMVPNDQVASPTGLTLDYANKRLYWVDNFNDNIHSCDLSLNDITHFVTESIGYLTDLVIQNGFLFYVGMNMESVMKVEISTGNKVAFMNPTAEIGSIETVSIQPGDPQPVNVGCQNNNGDCSTFCLPIPNSHMCGCAEGVLLLEDKKTCQGVKKECPRAIPFGCLVPDTDCFAIEGYSCSVACSEGYRRNPNHIFNKMTCTSTGDWDQNLNTICEPVTCPVEIPNGQLSAGCDRSVNAVCSVQCMTDYTPGPTGSLVSCQKTGYWTPDRATVCIPIVRCTPSVQNGMLSADCKVGTTCSVTCSATHSLSPHVLSVHCRPDGTISVNPNTVCEPIKCPDLDNVMLESSCLSKAGTACGFTCKDGFTAIYQGPVTCNTDGTWSKTSNELCQAVTCDEALPGTNLSPGTTPKANMDFTFTCNDAYVKNNDVQSVRCLSTGSWSIKPNSLCAVASVTGPEKQTSSNDMSAGVGYGVLAMVLLILIVLAIGYFYYRSRKTSKARFVESPNVTFSGNNEFHNPTAHIDSTNISNPQYGMTDPASNRTTGPATQNPYDNLPAVKTMDVSLDVADTNGSNGSNTNPYYKF